MRITEKIIIITLSVFLFWIFWPVSLSADSEKCIGPNRVAGIKTAVLFPITKKVPHSQLLADNNVCKYDFYEGILIGARFSGKEAAIDKICTEINKRLPKKLWNSCYFDIGTSISYSGRENPDWGSMLELVDAGVDFCEALPGDKKHCSMGVYNGINVSYHNERGDSLLPIGEGNPFGVCKETRHKNYSVQCMKNLVSYLYKYSERDISKSMEYIFASVPEGEDRYEVAVTFFSGLAFESDISEDEISDICMGLKDSKYVRSCVEGYSTGIVETASDIGMAADGVVRFCLRADFDLALRKACIFRAFSELPSEDKKGECIKRVPEIYYKSCQVE